VTPATYREGLRLGFVCAQSCADDDCEAVHVSSIAPSASMDGLTAGVVADEDARRDGWRRGRCPEHATGAAS
jgi:hypothetical protein